MICVTADDAVVAAEVQSRNRQGNRAFRRCREVLQVIDVTRARKRAIRPYKQTPPCTSGALRSFNNFREANATELSRDVIGVAG